MNPENIELTDAERWRLLLGEVAENQLFNGFSSNKSDNESFRAMDSTLAWLYGRQEEGNAQEQFDRQGGDGCSTLDTPEWINKIQMLFPKATIERLEKDAMERYHIDDIVTSPEALARAIPNPTLLSAVLRTKHLMNPEVLDMARTLVAQVVAELMKKLEQEIIACFSGIKNPVAYKRTGSFSQFAVKETLKRNLKNYQPNSGKILIEQPWFHLTERNNPKKWQIILVVDQSASMVSSVIHSAITAACFWQLPNMNTHLLAFDTQVVDLTDDVADPVEMLMQAQLGGGTNIAHAMEYASDLIIDCRRAMVILISDFYEGGDERALIKTTESLCTQGTRVLGLAALDENANPDYDKRTAQQLVQVGAEVGAMTPGELAVWIAEVLG